MRDHTYWHRLFLLSQNNWIWTTIHLRVGFHISVVWQVLATLFDLLITLWHLSKLSLGILFIIWVNISDWRLNWSTFLCFLQLVFWLLPTFPRVDPGRCAHCDFLQCEQCGRESPDCDLHRQHNQPQVDDVWKKSLNFFQTVSEKIQKPRNFRWNIQSKIAGNTII